MKKEIITRNEYLQLVGLVTIADQHYRQQREIERAMLEITGAEEDGHITDLLYSDEGIPGLDQALKWLNIAVEQAEVPDA